MHSVTLRYSDFSEAENTLLLISGRRLNQFILLPNITWAGTEQKKKKERKRNKGVVLLLLSFVDSLLRHIELQVCDTSFI